MFKLFNKKREADVYKSGSPMFNYLRALANKRHADSDHSLACSRMLQCIREHCDRYTGVITIGYRIESFVVEGSCVHITTTPANKSETYDVLGMNLDRILVIPTASIYGMN